MTTATRTRRRRTGLVLLSVLCALAVLAGCAPPPQPVAVVGQRPTAPVWPRTADPSVLAEGANWWVYASDNGFHLPVRRVSDPRRAYTWTEWRAGLVEGMPTLPAWSDSWSLWAPTVAFLGGRYVLFFAASRTGAPDPRNPQCIGRAFAARPDGPFLPEPHPFSCGLDGWRGALDPQLFTAPDGRVYLHAAFSDTEAPLHTIELTPSGDPVALRPDWQAAYRTAPLLGRQWPWEEWFIENPSMAYSPDSGGYLLAYSAGDWRTGRYSTGLARCTSPVGPCRSTAAGPWLASGAGRTGVGGLSFFTAAGRPWAVYASYRAGDEGSGWRRDASVGQLLEGPFPRLG